MAEGTKWGYEDKGDRLETMAQGRTVQHTREEEMRQKELFEEEQAIPEGLRRDLAKLTHTIRHTYDIIRKLSDHLEPMLIPEAAAAMTGNTENDMPNQSMMRGQIQQLTALVRDQQTQLETLTVRIDL